MWLVSAPDPRAWHRLSVPSAHISLMCAVYWNPCAWGKTAVTSNWEPLLAVGIPVKREDVFLEGCQQITKRWQNRLSLLAFKPSPGGMDSTISRRSLVSTCISNYYVNSLEGKTASPVFLTSTPPLGTSPLFRRRKEHNGQRKPHHSQRKRFAFSKAPAVQASCGFQLWRQFIAIRRCSLSTHERPVHLRQYCLGSTAGRGWQWW